ncbi:toll/interleukin-1 receptor domain-containing protein [candidate division WOR-3 bacterium]|nr:toll/interleukin-1 receptor domain-containing protein [candidate division WOR-3 bacterium]
MFADVPNVIRPGGKQPHIVIAYTYADNEFARRLAGALRREGISPWVDEVDMSVGVILVNRLAHSLRPADFVIPLISAASLNARWVRQDLRAVASRNFKGRRVRVLPARVDGAALPDHLRAQSYIDFHAHGWKRTFEDLKVILRPGGAPRPTARPEPEFELPHPIRRPPPEKQPEGKLVYVSYDYENDGYYKDVLLTWTTSPDFPRLSVNDQPVDYPVDTDEAEPLKHVIYGKIKTATAFLCVVGEKTSMSDWVNWEVKTAIELGKRMVVVRIDRDCPVPDALSEVGPTCALSFTFEDIKRAVAEAYGVVAQE